MILSEILATLRELDPQTRSVSDPEFDCLETVPFPLRWIAFSEYIEAEIENGGLGQLLWNTYYHWREILTVSQSGYQAYGFADEAAAVSDFIKLFTQYSDICRSFIKKRGKDGARGDFSGFMNTYADEITSPHEPLFYSSSTLRARKETWCRDNSAVLIGAIEDLRQARK